MKMKWSFLIIFVLLPFAAMGREASSGDAVDVIKDEIAQRWRTEYLEENHLYRLTSPAYPIEREQGCVIYRHWIPESQGRVFFSRMNFEKLYFATAFGDKCAEVDPGRFFLIDESSSPYRVLDFVRRVYAGPQAGRDNFRGDALARIRLCFSENRGQSVGVRRAESRWKQDATDREYLIVLHCPQLERTEEIFASGVDGKDEISWEIRASVQVDVDGLKH